MNKYILIIVGILCSALAQVLMKKSSIYQLKDIQFYIFLGTAALTYVISFISYAFILKSFPISRISPVMTISTMIIIVIIGILFFKEILSIRQCIGILFGLISIFLLIA